MARELLILLLCATMAFLLGNGYWKSFRSGALTLRRGGLTLKVHTFRRDKEPIRYWLGMAAGTLGFLVMVSAAAFMAFLVCVDLFGTSK